MLIAVTGTPGAGKSTVSKLLADHYRVIDIHSYAEENGLFEEYDEDAGSYDVDVERLNDSLKGEMGKDEVIILDGHLSHFVDCDKIIVLRCDPSILERRLSERGYDREKISENVQAELLDVILCESVDSGIETHELDCSGLSPEQVCSHIVSIIDGRETFPPGSVDWSDQMDRWF